MDNLECMNPAEEHARTIIHIDIDCFYAQVETIKEPQLKNQPIGIKQKNIVVTSNYLARQYGIKKCMSIMDAKKLCPHLHLVNGEDLKDYRDYSTKVHEILRKYSTQVERLGLDENFIDVSELVKNRLDTTNFTIIGNEFGRNRENSSNCYCGCYQRLVIGSQIAGEIRADIFKTIQLETSAGIAYNKLLAKLVGETHKPNQQTVIFAEQVDELMQSLKHIRLIPGIGAKLSESLTELAIKNVNDVLNCPLEMLELKLGTDNTRKVLKLCHGIDITPVKVSTRPQSIGLEDSCKNIRVLSEVENKFRQLLVRLLELVAKDGRIPTTLRVTVRKYNPALKTSHREQKQCPISALIFKSKREALNGHTNVHRNKTSKSIFGPSSSNMPHSIENSSHVTPISTDEIELSKQNTYYKNNAQSEFKPNTNSIFVKKVSCVPDDDVIQKLLILAMKLFNKLVDIKKSFHITLLGVSFTKFQETTTDFGHKQNIVFMLMKNVSVQEVTSLENNSPQLMLEEDSLEQLKPMEVDGDNNCSNESVETEPSPKKTKLTSLLSSRRRCLLPDDNSCTSSSPSKLRVADLRLNSFESDSSPSPITAPPPNIDKSVFNALPSDIQMEIVNEWKVNAYKVSNKSSNKNTILNYFKCQNK